MSARPTTPRCAACRVGLVSRDVWCDRCALDAEQLLGVVRGVLAPMRDGNPTAALLDGIVLAVQGVAGYLLAERPVARHAQDHALDVAHAAWSRGMALATSEAEREYDAARAKHDGTVAEVRRERVLALEGLATRARRLWHLLAPTASADASEAP